jgi:hypothetical protein
MQNNPVCYSFDSKNRTTKAIALQKDAMNGGYMARPADTSYIDPSLIELQDNETLILKNEKWIKISYYVNSKLYHKENKTELTINEVGKTKEDYSDYTDTEIPDIAFPQYYNFSETIQSWEFDIEQYKTDQINLISQRCVEENYKILPQHKRDNIYAGSPASDNYPSYLQGETGKTTIAKLNQIFQKISEKAKSGIQSANTKSDVDEIVFGIIFPSEAEILASI